MLLEFVQSLLLLFWDWQRPELLLSCSVSTNRHISANEINMVTPRYENARGCLDNGLTLQFPAMEARRPQEAVLDGVESCPPGHSSNAGAGWWRWVGCTCWALLWRMDRCPLGGREGTSPWRGVRGDLYDGDRFGAWVSTRRE